MNAPTVPQVGERTCAVCGQSKPLDQFSLKDGKPRHGRCKRCHADAEARRRKKLPRPPARTCADCSADISDRGPQARLCVPCVRDRKKRSPAERSVLPAPDVEAVLQAVRGGMTVELACRTLSVSNVTVWRRKEADPAFAGRLAQALAEWETLNRRPCGTVAAYDRGCRCDACRAACTAQSRQWRETIRGRASTNASSRRARNAARAAQVPHGTVNGYQNYACRCEACTAACREPSSIQQKRAQARTIDQAHRHGAQWTGPELELLSREDLSASQVATMVGRTYWAIQTARRRLRYEPKYQMLAGRPVSKSTGRGSA